MNYYFDPDEWETVITNGSHGPGLGFGGISQRRRSAEAIARIKLERAQREACERYAQAVQTIRAGKPRIRVKAGSAPA